MVQQRLGRGLASLIPTTVSKDQPAQTNEILVDLIKPNKHQPRQMFDKEALDELAASIEETGVLQPILVTPSVNPGEYDLVAGERRWRAAKLIGLKTVPVIIKKLSPMEQVHISLIENLQREDLNAIEEAVAYQKLLAEFNMTQEDIAKRLGKSRPYIANTVRLLDLPAEVQTLVSKNEISPGNARTLLSLNNKDEIVNLANRIITERLIVRETESIVKEIKKTNIKKDKKSVKKYIELSDAADELQRVLGTKVKISGTPKRGRIILHYYSLSDLERIVTLLNPKSKKK